MRRFICTALASMMLLSAVSCGKNVPDEKTSVTASAGAEKYVTLFEERVEEMPDSLVLATGDDAAAYGVDVSGFADDEGYAIRAKDGEVVILAKTAAGIDRGVRHITAYGNWDNYSFTYGEDYRVKNLTVMGKPIEEFAIVRPDDADRAMCNATEELVKYVSLATGVSLPIYSKSDYDTMTDAPANKIELSIDYPGHGDEAFTIDVKSDGNIDILCGRYRGGLYGVYGLLEDMGWRFIGDGTEYVYETDSLNLTEDCDRTEDGSIKNRYIWPFDHYNGTKLHAHGRYLSQSSMKEYGFYGLVAEACHGLYNNPIDWQGTFFGHDQPCYTNEDVLQVIEDYYRGYIEAQLAAGRIPGYDLNYIDVAQYDGMASGFCICSSCLEVMGEEGSQSGAVLRMTNRMADMAAEYDPNICALMLAYCGTNKPPRVTRPRDNVKIAYAFYISDTKTPIICSNHNINDRDCSHNVNYFEEFEEWKQICSPETLQVWYYPFNAYEIACTVSCIDTAYEDMKYLTESGIDCVMLNSEFGNDAIWVSVIADLLWDGDMTEEEYLHKVREYYSIAYGKGGEYVMEYMNILLKAGDLAGCWTSFSSSAREMFSYEYMAANFDYLMGLFDVALKYAETEQFQNRIEIMKAQMMYVCINAVHESDYVNGTADQRSTFEERYAEMYRLYKKHSIVVYDSTPKVYAPEEIDFSRKPEDHWCESITRG